MSNHGGGYLLNHVLHLLEHHEVFKKLGADASRDLILEIVKMSDRYDCNPGEILDEIGERLGICYYCLKSCEALKHGLCRDCLGEEFDEDDEE